jgi:predicted metalloprotease with PDZ domain
MWSGSKLPLARKTLAWHRDDANMYLFHVQVPAGVDRIDVAFDLISPPETGGFSSGSSATSQLAVVSWNQVLLYPAGTPSDQLNYKATLKVPSGWSYASALPIAQESGNIVQFKTAALTTLVDSPVLTGTHFKTIELNPGGQPPVYLNLAADSAHATEITTEETDHFRNLVKEAGALFGAHHYRDYHFLLTLSDHVAHFGLEHHESSDDRIAERSLVDDAPRKLSSGLLPHEYVHSWNGKFRRPAGLATGDYDHPMKGNLLWVYEGLTEYLGEILTPRSGLQTPEEYRDELAMTAAALDRSAGRAWRPLEDTTVAAQLLYSARSDYAEYRRGVDYYPEGSLIWLEADTLIREKSNHKRSLDNFIRAFFGPPDSAPQVKPYTFDDLVIAMNAVQQYDWAMFFRTRVQEVRPRGPLAGIENAGYLLVFDDKPGARWKLAEGENKFINLRYSIGLTLKDDGEVLDVAVGGPAQTAGIAPGYKIIAVNSRAFSGELMHDALREARSATKPTEFLVRDGDYFKTIAVDYHGGEKYPHLQRVNDKPDILARIIAPRVKP